MKFGVVVFPGSNCDRDTAYVTRYVLAQPTRLIWHTEGSLADIDVVVIPGGFSYGDYLRCGAIARFSPVMRAVVAHAQQGGLVLGICNGFQVLTEAGLLPGALVRNKNLHFICDRVPVRVVNNHTVWTRQYSAGQILPLPIAHGEGCYFADERTLQELQEYQQIVFQYADNPNGSLLDIAGICNRQGNVLGMMPHPERASDATLGNVAGLPLFAGLVA